MLRRILVLACGNGLKDEGSVSFLVRVLSKSSKAAGKAVRFGYSCAAVTHHSKPTPGGERPGTPIEFNSVKASGEGAGFTPARNAESEHPSLGSHAFDVVGFCARRPRNLHRKNEA